MTLYWKSFGEPAVINLIAIWKKLNGQRLEEAVAKIEHLAEVGAEALAKGADENGKRH